MRKEKALIAGKIIEVIFSNKEEAPVVYSFDFSENAEEVLTICSQINCPTFHLVSITGIRWEEELSPWPHESVITKKDHFAGEADAFLAKLEAEIVPYVNSLIPKSSFRVLNGYSMGGLFSLYAAQKSELFDGCSAPSGSVWYPEFTEFVRKNTFIRKPKAIYLSLGDRESKTRKPYLSETESKMRELAGIYRDKNIICDFEMNEGNHFQDVNNRIAKGLKWVLTTIEG